MIPNHFILLDKFPLNSNGKIDKKNLPLPQSYLHVNTNQIPLTFTQYKISQIWSKILKLPYQSINIHQSFFSIGGNSVKAIQLISQLSAEFGKFFNLKHIFENPTIALQSDFLSNQNSILIHRIQPIGNQDYYELSPMQKRLWVLHQFEEAKTAYNILELKILKYL